MERLTDNKESVSDHYSHYLCDQLFRNGPPQLEVRFRPGARSVQTNMECQGHSTRTLKNLKGHNQLVHMRFRYYLLADLHITLHHKPRAEKRIL